jgi:RNA polymerase sigma-70 factor (ECF subfamily)
MDVAAERDSDITVLAQSLGRPERFAEIYQRYFTEIFRYVAGRLGVEAAEDPAAETFLIAFRRRERFDPERGAVRPWLFGIATKVIAQHRRTEARRYQALARVASRPAADDHQDQVADRLAAWELRGELAGALARLSAAERDVLLLTAVAGLDHAETALALSIPAGTVGSRLFRARRKLRTAIEKGTDHASQ